MSIRSSLVSWGMVLIVSVALVGVAVYEVVSWKECLRDHAWWYCLRILSK